MTFSVYLPPAACVEEAFSGRLPVLYWLSGLTCTDENFVQKSGAQRLAARLGIIIVAPDTSPRGEGVAVDPEGAWDLGAGAGFYLNATQSPWAANYRMYDYLIGELPALIEENFPVDVQRQSVSGHSMGGHGALILALKNPGRFRSVSAFAPICAPARCPWGEKAFTAYLGPERERWQAWDASQLIRTAEPLPVLIDQGGDDVFLRDQLHPDLLIRAAAEVGFPLDYRLRPGYDHSYFFIATFMEHHLEFHHAALSA